MRPVGRRNLPLKWRLSTGERRRRLERIGRRMLKMARLEGRPTRKAR